MNKKMHPALYTALSLLCLCMALLGLYFTFAPQSWVGIPENKVPAGFFLFITVVPMLAALRSQKSPQ